MLRLTLTYTPKAVARLAVLLVTVAFTVLGPIGVAEATDPPTPPAGGFFRIEEETHYAAQARCTYGGATLRQGGYRSSESARGRAVSWLTSTCVLFSSSSSSSYTYNFYRWTATCSEPLDMPPASGITATRVEARAAQNAWLDAHRCESFTSTVAPIPDMTATAYRWNATCRVQVGASNSQNGFETWAAALAARSAWGASTCSPAGGVTSVGPYQAFRYKAYCNDGSLSFVGSWHPTKRAAESAAQTWTSTYCPREEPG